MSNKICSLCKGKGYIHSRIKNTSTLEMVDAIIPCPIQFCNRGIIDKSCRKNPSELCVNCGRVENEHC